MRWAWNPVSLVMAILPACFTATGQTAAPVFEVASVKPATPLGPRGLQSNRRGGPGSVDPGMYTCENCPVFWVLSEAYDLQPWEYVGPEWVHSVRFDFAAKVPPGTSKEAFQTMLQNLLVDRFRLAAHREKKEMTVYEMTVARNGPKLRESGPPEAREDDGATGKLRRDAEGFPILGKGTTMAVVPGHARIRSDNQPLEWFVHMLSAQLQGPVIDSTGLKAKYDFVLSWAWEENNEPGAGSGAAAPDPYRPALMSAVQSQLGLRLQQRKGQAGVLVVERMEKVPTAN